jgi:hypothetical protein
MTPRNIAVFAAGLLLAQSLTTCPAHGQGKEVRLVTLAYTHGFASKDNGVKLHLRFNEDEKPGDRPVFLWPISATNPTWVIVPEFSADLGNADDVAPNNIVGNVRFETARAEAQRRLVAWHLGPQWNAARDFRTSLLLVGGGITYDWFNRPTAEKGLIVALELSFRADVGPRFNKGNGTTPVTFRATPTGLLTLEHSWSRFAGSLTGSGKLFAFANDDFQVDSTTRYRDRVLGVWSIALEFRPQAPDPVDSQKPHKWPLAFVAKYTNGRAPPAFKKQNTLELGGRLYWSPPVP